MRELNYMTSDEKICPDCAETVKAAARKCKHCGYEFFPARVVQQLPGTHPPHISLVAAIYLAPPEIEDVLATLVERSLVSFDPATGRYSLLESVRQYGSVRLEEAGERETWSGRHLAYWRAVAEESEPRLQGPDAKVWLERLDPEHDNMRAAMEWSLQIGQNRSDRLESGLLLAVALARYWRTRGFYAEGRSWLDSFLTAGNALDEKLHSESLSLALGRGMSMAGRLAWRQGDYAAARALAERSLILLKPLGDHPSVAATLMDLGNVAYFQSDYQAARDLYEESLSLYRSLDDRSGAALVTSNLGLIAHALGDLTTAYRMFTESLALARDLGMKAQAAAELTNLGGVAASMGDFAQAHRLHREAYEIARELGDRWREGMALHNLGYAVCGEHDHAEAQTYLRESLRIFRKIGDKIGVAFTLEALATVAFALEGVIPAAQLWGAAERLRETMGAPPLSSHAEACEKETAEARAALQDDEAFDAAWASGRDMGLEQAIALVLDEA